MSLPSARPAPTAPGAASPVGGRNARDGDGTADRALVVTEKRSIARHTVELLLRRPNGTPLPRWWPGAHIDLLLPDGRIRPYSLSGDPADRTSWRLLVRRRHASSHPRVETEPGDAPTGGVSAHLHDSITPGDRVTFRGPHDRFRLVGARSFLFLAHGAGIAPLLPMARLVKQARVYPWTLVYVDCDHHDSPLTSEVRAFGGRAEMAAEFDIGRLLARAATGTAVYVCGPGRFIGNVDQAVAEAPHVDLHSQRFDRSAPAANATGAGDLVLARSGARIHVPAGTPLLAALLDAGIEVPYACGAGICGACAVGVLAGEVRHRDSTLSRAERASGRVIVTCVSLAGSHELVLDL